jgi:hypothetical protein
MASVRMTNELQLDICRNADKAYSLSNPTPKPNNEYVAAVRKAITDSPEQTYLRDIKKLGEERGIDKESRYGPNILPQPPKETVTGVELRVTNAGDAISQRNAHRNFRETDVKFDTPMAGYLVGIEGNRWVQPSVWINDMRTEDQTQVLELFEAFKKLSQEHNVAKETYQRSIRDLVTRCTTLKQLLEIWPAAESLVPTDKIQKLHTKVTRIERATQIKEEIRFDPTIANQAVLTAKMLGG